MKPHSQISISPDDAIAITSRQPAHQETSEESRMFANLFLLALFAMLLAPLTISGGEPGETS